MVSAVPAPFPLYGTPSSKKPKGKTIVDAGSTEFLRPCFVQFSVLQLFIFRHFCRLTNGKDPCNNRKRATIGHLHHHLYLRPRLYASAIPPTGQRSFIGAWLLCLRYEIKLLAALKVLLMHLRANRPVGHPASADDAFRPVSLSPLHELGAISYAHEKYDP